MSRAGQPGTLPAGKLRGHRRHLADRKCQSTFLLVIAGSAVGVEGGVFVAGVGAAVAAVGRSRLFRVLGSVEVCLVWTCGL